jgi:hypothetical protein
MFVHDEIDAPAALRRSGNRPRWTLRVRHFVYPQLFALVLSILVGQCERWGYSGVLETGIPGMFFPLAIGVLACSAFAFPVAIWALLQDEASREQWSRIALPLSILMSVVQVLAILFLYS